MNILLGILMLLFIDVILSIDNAILIATTTKSLGERDKKIAEIIGASLAVFLRMIFVIIIMFTLELLAGIPGIYLIGGIIIIFLAFSITKEKDVSVKNKSSKNLLKVIAMIVAGDIMMSFDNAFIIADIVVGMETLLWIEITTIVIALAISLVIIIFFSDYLGKLLKKYEWLIYIAAWLLISVGIEMFFKDYLWNIIAGDPIVFDINGIGLNDPYFEEYLTNSQILFISYLIGALITYGRYSYIKNKKSL